MRLTRQLPSTTHSLCVLLAIILSVNAENFSPDSPVRPTAAGPLDESSNPVLSPSPETPSPTPFVLDDRAVVDAPPGALHSDQTQQSPVMTINIDGKQIVYTQKFSAVPDQWPTPEPGTIGLGTLEGDVGKTSTLDKRGVPRETGIPTSGQIARCRTWDCRRLLEQEAQED
ncbi:hypothetical protein VTO42DRAFT_7321 [Malbranchea cinnamomea]